MSSATTAPVPARPWYREPGPWFVMAGPAIVVVASLFTAWLAWSTDDGVVADDYYKRGLVINKEIQRSRRGEALRLGAVLTVDPGGAVRVEFSRGSDTAAWPAIRVQFANATRAGLDRTATLTRGADGAYAGRIESPPPGRWLVIVETDAWRMPTTEVGGAVTEVRLGIARAPD
jgi:hypothetical protein